MTTNLVNISEANPTYAVDYLCMNCKKTVQVRIPKGKLVCEFEDKCPNCGCTADQYNQAHMQRSMGNQYGGNTLFGAALGLPSTR